MSTANIDRTVAKTDAWIRLMADELKTEDLKYAQRALRAFLHTLRDRLGVNQAAQLASQMPDLMRGIYYENWTPARTPEHYRDLGTFLDRIADHAGFHGETEASFAAAAGAEVLRRIVSAGEIEDVAASLPASISLLIR